MEGGRPVPGECLTLFAYGIGIGCFTTLTLAVGKAHTTLSLVAYGAGQCGSSAVSQSLTHPLPHPVPEFARSEHLDVGHPGENPARQFLATGGLQAELQRAVPTLP
jgi:hypothetical protein